MTALIDSTDFTSISLHQRHHDLGGFEKLKRATSKEKPYSRSATLSSEGSTLVEEGNANGHHQGERVITAPRRSQSAMESLLDEVFSAVTLPSVDYLSRPSSTDTYYTSSSKEWNTHVQQNRRQQHAVDSAIAELEHALEDHPVHSPVHSDMEHSTTTNDAQTVAVDQQAIEDKGVTSFKHNIIINRNEDGNGEETRPMRSMTTDSWISATESRFGSYNIQEGDESRRSSINNATRPQPRPKSIIRVPKLRPLPNKTPKHDEVGSDDENGSSPPTPKAAKVITLQGEASRPESVHSISRTLSLDTIGSKQISLCEEDVAISEVLEKQLDNAQSLGTEGGIEYIQPHIEVVIGSTENLPGAVIEKVFVGGINGQRQSPTKDDKVVLLFGPVGSGKTSLLMSILNYLYDVKKEHEFRLALEDPRELEPTDKLTAYVLQNTIYPYSITIVDTPGVQDVEGYTHTSDLVSQWFKKELKETGTFRLDAISIVLRHNQGMLKWPLIDELARIRELFDDDLKSNVLPIVTDAEALPQPLAIKSLVMANINFIDYYKVQNEGTLPLRPGGNALKHLLHFNQTTAALERFFKDLDELVEPLLAVLRGKRRE